MSGAPALALSGSNVTGDVAYSCALAAHGSVFATATTDGRGDLAALVARLCSDAGVAPAAIGELRVDVGPGSYTGLRVAATFVRFLQRFGGLPVLAVDSLALLAARVPAAAGPLPVLALLDARRQRVHTQRFVVAPGRIEPTGPPAAVPLEQAVAGLAAGCVVAAPATLPPALAAPLRAAGAVLRAEIRVTAAELFAPGLPLLPASAADLEPRYLMGSYAEP